MNIALINANSLHIPLADGSIQCCVTSPPYWGLRSYGIGIENGELGLEQTPDEYVAHLVDVFREVWRVLRDDGTVWLNLGDSYCGYKGDNYGVRPESSNLQKNSKVPTAHEVGTPHTSGLKPKNLVGIPWRVALALQADGWYLRSDIIWAKPNPMPESVTDRPTKAHEYIFLLTKSAKYYYDIDAIREPLAPTSLPRALRGVSADNKWANGAPGSTAHTMSQPRPNQRKEFEKTMAAGGSNMPGHSGYYDANGRLLVNPGGRNRRTVWTVATEPTPYAHFATFPRALVEPCIKAGCPAGGVVLDPFAGSGTTGIVARELGRDFVGLDLSLTYLSTIARKRLGLDALKAWIDGKQGEAQL